MRYICVFILLLVAETLFGQQTCKFTTPSVIAYLQSLPSDYHSNTDKYPLVLFLHGIGERGPNTTDTAVLRTYINNVAKLGPPKYAASGTDFPFILISPQLKNNNNAWPVNYVLEVLNYCKTYLRIDERRIYITGLSLGGGGAWVMSQSMPQLFAALAPVCGGINDPAKACNIAAENLPVWAFHGDKDPIVPLNKSVFMVNAINQCLPSPNPLARMTIYPNVDHSAWNFAYRPDHTIHNPNVYEWMMAQRNLKNGGNSIPVANAGADITTSAASYTLRASASDADGAIVSWQWSQIQGVPVTLSGATTSSLSLSNLKTGKYIFKVQVKDDHGNTDSDYVSINVNTAFTASAGSDKLVKLPVNATTLFGVVSNTTSVSAYSWVKLSGPACTMSNATTATLKLNALVSGSYAFRFVVKTVDGRTFSDDAAVTVDHPPIVNAGTDKTLILPQAEITLYGSASDPDGAVVSYRWSKYSGPNAVIGDNTLPALHIAKLYQGTYVFRLTATDDKGVAGVDYVTVTVK